MVSEWTRSGVSLAGVLGVFLILAATAAAAPPPPVTVAPPAATVAPPAPAAEPVKVKVGLFVTQLYDLDMAKRSFSTNFWAWYLHPDKIYKPLETVEIVNAKATTIKFTGVTSKDDVIIGGEKKQVFWDQGKYAVTAFQDWDVTNFPFDRQVLHLQMEDGQNDSSQTALIADVENSKIDSSVSVPGWIIESFKIKARDTVYETTYGDPTLQGTSSYSRVTASITVRREGVRLLGSMFIGFFVAFALTCLTYFLDTDWMAGSRVGMCGGAIFASVGNKYVVDNYLPPVSTFTLADAIEASTFMAIIFSIMVVVLVKAIKEKRPVLADWINHGGFMINCFGYLTFNGIMIARAAA
ncbi:MAG: hypothetical protein WCO00_07145 [Rhodospirillaceae bacterium]